MAAVMLLNYGVNVLLLIGTAALSGERVNFGSLLTASLLGAAHAGACLLPGFRFLGGGLWRLISLGGMSVLAFGWKKGTLRLGCCFAVLTMALEGAARASAGESGWPSLLLAAAVCLLGRFAFGASRNLLPVEISGDGKTVRLTALLDTGNELRDPVTGERVLIVGADAAKTLTGLSLGSLKDPLTTLARGEVAGLRLVPYRTVGDGGMLLAMRFPSVRVGGRKQPGIVAFAPGNLGGESYQALAGGIV